MTTEELHFLVWKRFVRMPYGHVLDCADENGEAFIPTGEECRNGIPTIVGWTTSIADCAFFSGLYLYGLCEKYKRDPDERTAKEMSILADGLLLLCRISKTDGFIARGVADDGVSHYPCSSEDQFGPWLLGLRAYLKCGVCDDEKKIEIDGCIVRTLKGVIGAGWKIPSELEGQTCGAMTGCQWRCCAKLVFAASTAKEYGILTEEEYEALLDEVPEGNVYSRLSILSRGFAGDMIRETNLIQFWIYTCGHLSLRESALLDPKHGKTFDEAARANGAAVTRFLRDYKEYNKRKTPDFRHDWRVLIPEIGKRDTFDEAFADASRLNGLWAGKYNKERNNERGPLAQSVFGIWIAVTSGDEEAVRYGVKCLEEAKTCVDWKNVGHSYPFVLESAGYFVTRN